MPKPALSKSKLIEAISNETNVPKKDIDAVLHSLSEIVIKEVLEDHIVVLPGIGRISGRDRPKRTVRNPTTGAPIEKEADRAPKITFAKGFKDSINN